MKDATGKKCPAEQTLTLLGTKWTALIIHALTDRTLRFGELTRALPGISPRTLSARMTELEKERIVTKKIFPEVPPRVEYTLTKHGAALASIIKRIDTWSRS